jgi:hypothetical protein
MGGSGAQTDLLGALLLHLAAHAPRLSRCPGARAQSVPEALKVEDGADAYAARLAQDRLVIADRAHMGVGIRPRKRERARTRTCTRFSVFKSTTRTAHARRVTQEKRRPSWPAHAPTWLPQSLYKFSCSVDHTATITNAPMAPARAMATVSAPYIQSASACSCSAGGARARRGTDGARGDDEQELVGAHVQLEVQCRVGVEPRAQHGGGLFVRDQLGLGHCAAHTASNQAVGWGTTNRPTLTAL